MAVWIEFPHPDGDRGYRNYNNQGKMDLEIILGGKSYRFQMTPLFPSAVMFHQAPMFPTIFSINARKV